MTRLRAAAATALLSLSLAAPALADRGDWDDDHGDRRGYRVHRHDRSCDHDGYRGHRGGDYDRYRDRRYDDDRGGRWYFPRGDSRYRERDRYRDHHDRRYRHRDEYGCRPCGRRWSNADPFHRHLVSYHRVPQRAIPRVLVFFDGGWLFRG